MVFVSLKKIATFSVFVQIGEQLRYSLKKHYIFLQIEKLFPSSGCRAG